jgi:hypothetical protein
MGVLLGLHYPLGLEGVIVGSNPCGPERPKAQRFARVSYRITLGLFILLLFLLSECGSTM